MVDLVGSQLQQLAQARAGQGMIAMFRASVAAARALAEQVRRGLSATPAGANGQAVL